MQNEEFIGYWEIYVKCKKKGNKQTNKRDRNVEPDTLLWSFLKSNLLKGMTRMCSYKKRGWQNVQNEEFILRKSIQEKKRVFKSIQ